MADKIEQIKERIDIVALISEYIDLKKAGRNYKALCPFHQEKTPSFMVSPELQIFKCFGCGVSGDVFSFLEKYEGMDFYEALKFLAERTGVKLDESYFEKSDKEKIYRINFLVTHFYHFILLNHPRGKKALDYLLKTRGLKEETVKTFKLGYSPEDQLALSNFLIRKKGFTREDLEETGIFYFREGRILDRFAGRVIFPFFDYRGNVVGFQGRVLPGASADLAKYVNTPETKVYHKSNFLYGLNVSKEEIRKKEEAIVVEGALDVISPWQIGVKNICGVCGSSLTDGQAKILSRFCKKIVLAMDTDFAGNEAVVRGLEKAESYGLEIFVVNFSPYKDPDEIAHKEPELLINRLEKPKFVWDFILELIFSRNKDKKNFIQAVSREAIPILSRISDKILQAHYLGLVAQKLSVPLDSVRNELERYQKSGGVSVSESEALIRPEKRTRQEILEERLLVIAFTLNPDLLLQKEVERLISSPLFIRIVEALRNYKKSYRKFDRRKFFAKIPEEIRDGFAGILLKEVVDEKVNLEKEFNLVKNELRIILIKRKLGKLGAKIKKLEEKKDYKKIRIAQKKFSKLTKKLSFLQAKS